MKTPSNPDPARLRQLALRQRRDEALDYLRVVLLRPGEHMQRIRELSARVRELSAELSD